MIDKYTSHISSQLKKGQRPNIFLLRIQNLEMLITAHGHKHALELINNFAEHLKTHGKVFHITTGQIILVTAFQTSRFELQLKNEASTFGKNTHLDCQIASYHANDEALDPESILAALYHTITTGGSVFGAAPTQNPAQMQAEMKIAAQIKLALDENRFALAYQPIVTADGKISHYECLLRLKSEDGTLQSAGSFIHIAEKMGLIDLIDVMVMELVIEKLAADPNLRLAFNISNLSIGNKMWIKRFYELITPEIGKRMIIEITETSAVRDIKETAFFIATLQNTGACFALDDFGSGYTSFRQIRSLSFDYIKIDGSLIHDIATNPHNRILVKSLIDYLKGLNVRTIAEFVENGETAKILIDYGINYMQGNYFGMAAPL